MGMLEELWGTKPRNGRVKIFQVKFYFVELKLQPSLEEMKQQILWGSVLGIFKRINIQQNTGNNVINKFMTASVHCGIFVWGWATVYGSYHCDACYDKNLIPLWKKRKEERIVIKDICFLYVYQENIWKAKMFQI